MSERMTGRPVNGLLSPTVTSLDVTLTRSELCECLKNDRRVRLIELVDERDDLSLSDLSEIIAAEENDVEPEQLTSAQRKRVYVAYYQVHLPKLEEWDIIEVDDKEDGYQYHMIRPGSNHEGVLEAVRYFDGVERDGWLYRFLNNVWKYWK